MSTGEQINYEDDDQVPRQHPRTILGLSEAALDDTQPIGLADGTLFSSVGNFEIKRFAGRGGMASVYLAYDRHLQRDVALKIPRLDLLGNSEFQKRFLREARVAAKLKHPGLVELYEYGIVGPLCFLASCWCDSGDLASWIEEHPGPHDPRMIARFIHQLSSAVAYCQAEGVLHLDIKPGNIMLNQQLSGVELADPRLTDFGMARLMEQSLAETRTSLMLGTPLYMSPEQANCRFDEIGPATDVFAIGIVMYELLSGERPFVGDSAIKVLDKIRSNDRTVLPPTIGIPSDLRMICQSCLEPRPGDRYPNAQALANDLGRFLAEDPIRARPVSLRHRLRYWMRKEDRIRQAGIATIAIQAPVLAGFFVLILAALLVDQPISSDIQSYAPNFALLFFGLHLPSLWVGVQALKRNWCAVPIGLMLSLSYFVPTMLTAIGVMPAMSIYDDAPLAKYLMHSLHALLAACQTVAFALALPAARRLFWQPS